MVPPILVGLGQLEPGDLVIVVFCVIGLHLFRAERSLSEAAGEPAENQSAGGHARAAVLGSGLGRSRTGARHPNHGRDQDCLRPRRVDENRMRTGWASEGESGVRSRIAGLRGSWRLRNRQKSCSGV